MVCGGRGATPKAKPPSESANKTRGRPKTEAESHGAQAEPKVARRGPPSRPRPRSVAQGEHRRKPSARSSLYLIFIITHIIPSRFVMLNQRKTFFPLPNGEKFLYEVLTYDFNLWGVKFIPKNPKGQGKKNACSQTLTPEELAFLSEFERSERKSARIAGLDSLERGFKRAQKRVFELLCSNADLNLFVTFTLSFGREDYALVIKRLSQWLDNRVRRNGLRYILVPEYHDDERSIHFHGVVNESALSLVNSGKRSGRKTVYNLPEWSLGFASAVRIGSKNEDWQRVAQRITDYMLKDSYGRVGGRFYLHGGFLREPIREYFFADYNTALGEEVTVGGRVSFKILRHL